MLRCWDGRDWYIVSLRGDGILESVKGLPAVEYGGSIDLVNPFEELKRYIRTRSGSACHPDGYLVTAAHRRRRPCPTIPAKPKPGHRRGNHSPSCSPGFASVCPKWDNNEQSTGRRHAPGVGTRQGERLRSPAFVPKYHHWPISGHKPSHSP